MKLSSISYTVITLAALTCSVIALPNPNNQQGGGHGQDPDATESGYHRRALEDDNLFVRSGYMHQQNGHGHAHADETLYRRDLEGGRLFARSTHHRGHSSEAESVYGRDLEGGRLFARSTRHQDQGSTAQHS